MPTTETKSETKTGVTFLVKMEQGQSVFSAARVPCIGESLVMQDGKKYAVAQVLWREQATGGLTAEVSLQFNGAEHSSKGPYLGNVEK